METKDGKTIVLKESRKTFLFIYLLIIVFIAIIAYFMKNGQKFSSANFLVITAVIITGLLIPEILRNWESCIVKGDKIHIITGIIKKKHHKLFTSTITDIHCKQTLWQRILNYGTIEVSLFSHEGEVRLGTVNRPKKRLQELEELIRKK